MIEKCEDEGIDDDALLKEFPLHQYQLMINSLDRIDSLEHVCTKMEKNDYFFLELSDGRKGRNTSWEDSM